MTPRAFALLAALAMAGLSGCRTPVEPAKLDARTMAREQRAAVMRPGARVCRRVPVGSAEHDWVRGTVVSVRGEWMTVRIDDPGRFANQVDGVSVAAGVTLLSEPRVWVPCL